MIDSPGSYQLHLVSHTRTISLYLIKTVRLILGNILRLTNFKYLHNYLSIKEKLLNAQFPKKYSLSLVGPNLFKAVL